MRGLILCLVVAFAAFAAGNLRVYTDIRLLVMTVIKDIIMIFVD